MTRLRTKVQNVTAIMAVAALATGALLALNSCSTTPALVTAPPDIPGATFVGNKACTECHPRISRIFPDSAHARIHLESAARTGQTGCESCHGAGSLHISSGGARRFIHNPAKDPGACFECHRPTQAEFQLPQHHPLPEKKMNCADCHDPHGSDIQKPASGLAMARVNETCSQCHREQSRPFIFEHQAMREGCTTCHSPHGSVNAKLLTQRDSNLCLRCHAQVQNSGVGTGHIFIGNVDHTTYVRMGSCWSSGCHTAVHGSNVDVRLRY